MRFLSQLPSNLRFVGMAFWGGVSSVASGSVMGITEVIVFGAFIVTLSLIKVSFCLFVLNEEVLTISKYD